jgi:hypothetical protein
MHWMIHDADRVFPRVVLMGPFPVKTVSSLRVTVRLWPSMVTLAYPHGSSDGKTSRRKAIRGKFRSCDRLSSTSTRAEAWPVIQ